MKIIVLLMLFLSIGCSKRDGWGIPYQKCLKRENYLAPVIIGKTTTLQTRSRCAVYSSEYYIENGNKIYILVEKK